MYTINATSEELLYDIDILKNKLIGNGILKKKHCTSYLESGDTKVEEFDYYGFSSVGPIVPPLDLACLGDNGHTDEVFNTVSTRRSDSDISVFSWLSSEHNYHIKPRALDSDSSESLSPAEVTKRGKSVIGRIVQGFRNLKKRMSLYWKQRSNKVDFL